MKLNLEYASELAFVTTTTTTITTTTTTVLESMEVQTHSRDAMGEISLMTWLLQLRHS